MIKENEKLIICAGALDKFGLRHQMIKLTEELGELQSALARYINAEDKDTRWSVGENVIEEMADVDLLLTQLKMAMDAKSVSRWEARKLDYLRKVVNGWRDPRLERMVEGLVARSSAQPELPDDADKVAQCGRDAGECEIRTN